MLITDVTSVALATNIHENELIELCLAKRELLRAELASLHLGADGCDCDGTIDLLGASDIDVHHNKDFQFTKITKSTVVISATEAVDATFRVELTIVIPSHLG